MDNTKRISTITIIVVLVIVVAIIVASCYIMGIINFNNNENAIYDESTQITEENVTKEFASPIEGSDNVTVLETGEKVNNSDGIYSKYTLGNFELENFEISCLDGVTKISCNVTNAANERKKLDGFYIFLNDQDGVCKACKLVDGLTLSSQESEKIDIIINADVANVYSIALKEVYSKNN